MKLKIQPQKHEYREERKQRRKVNKEKMFLVE